MPASPARRPKRSTMLSGAASSTRALCSPAAGRCSAPSASLRHNFGCGWRKAARTCGAPRTGPSRATPSRRARRCAPWRCARRCPTCATTATPWRRRTRASPRARRATATCSATPSSASKTTWEPSKGRSCTRRSRRRWTRPRRAPATRWCPPARAPSRWLTASLRTACGGGRSTALGRWPRLSRTATESRPWWTTFASVSWRRTLLNHPATSSTTPRTPSRKRRPSRRRCRLTRRRCALCARRRCFRWRT
mmetsp:Transcript_25454/g.87336  ORF Transcript_25454/g.87336 Transcript_25454/m.87336 type:complete len:251 (+) Transcript_25454:512-1264(+)